MKKIIITLYVLTSFALISMAQDCVPDFTVTLAGVYPAPSGATCFEQATEGAMVITVKNFTTAGPGGGYTIDSIFIDSLTNLPCGLKYSVFPNNKRLLTGEAGCIKVHGITNEPAGQYQVKIYGKVYGTPDIPIYEGQSAALDVLGLLNTPPLDYRYWVRVKPTGGACATLDVTPGSTVNKIASCKGIDNTSVNDINNVYTNLVVSPNPVMNNMTISFDADKSSDVTYTISSIAGQLISKSSYTAVNGSNTIEIDATNLSTGTYFISIVDGSSTVTKKFVKN
jgi:hypothetical protein